MDYKNDNSATATTAATTTTGSFQSETIAKFGLPQLPQTYIFVNLTAVILEWKMVKYVYLFNISKYLWNKFFTGDFHLPRYLIPMNES